MDVYIVKTKEEWDAYYPYLKQSSARGTTPELFVVGFDTEYICRGNFKDSFEESKRWVLDASHDIAVCSIQIASNTMCIIVCLPDLGHDMPKTLLSLLTSDCWIKAGVGVELDLKYLSQNYNLGHCSGGIELRNFAILAGLEKSNLEYLYSITTGIYTKKQKSIHDWSKEMSLDQFEYAAKDAIMSKEIFERIMIPTFDILTDMSRRKDNIKLNFKNINQKPPDKNFVGRLNEKIQEEKFELAEYIEETVEHGKNFIIKCKLMNKETVGNAQSKKEAKQMAAQLMYNHFFLL
jgi:hypothetical protein